MVAGFAFLTYEDEKTSALSIMQSLTFQLAGSNEELIGAVCESMTDLCDLIALTNLLSSLLCHIGLVYLVIDGLDEINAAERGRLTTELLRLANECKDLKIILSSRPEADLVQALDNEVITIQIHEHNESSIKGYVSQRSQDIFNSRTVLPRAQVEMRKLLAPVASSAKGMFLYARLIMDIVATMHDLSEIQNELSVLPENLDAA